jgi:hypothetical protein
LDKYDWQESGSEELNEYVAFYNGQRPHQGIQQQIPKLGESEKTGVAVRKSAVLGGLHCRYDRQAAHSFRSSQVSALSLLIADSVLLRGMCTMMDVRNRLYDAGVSFRSPTSRKVRHGYAASEISILH